MVKDLIIFVFVLLRIIFKIYFYGGYLMSRLSGTKTEKNLMEAFAGECKARTKYTYYAEQARKNGYVQIAKFFEETSDNEKEHAKIWFKLLNGGFISDTPENLQDAANGENYEWTDMYARMAKDAREEGFDDIAFLFEEVGKIENEHENRYLALLDNIKNNKVFSRDTKAQWICSNCGHVHDGESAPDVCPVCSHSKAYFELRMINY